MKLNFNNCSDIKGLRFCTKKSVLNTVIFYTHKKTQEGASIHRIDESFPLKPSLADCRLPNKISKITVPKGCCKFSVPLVVLDVFVQRLDLCPDEPLFGVTDRFFYGIES